MYERAARGISRSGCSTRLSTRRRVGHGGGASYNVEFGGLGVDGVFVGGAPYHVDAVAAAGGGPSAARWADVQGVGGDGVDVGGEDDVVGHQ